MLYYLLYQQLFPYISPFRVFQCPFRLQSGPWPEWTRQSGVDPRRCVAPRFIPRSRQTPSNTGWTVSTSGSVK